MNKPVPLADYCCHTGEGPLWHRVQQKLYWTDIPTGRVFRYDPLTGTHEQWLSGPVVSGMTVQCDGSLLFFGADGAIWRLGEDERVFIHQNIHSEIGSRFNDVGVDPSGRVFCGTMSSPVHPGRLYRLNFDGSLKVMIEGVAIANGIGFTSDRRTLYFAESVPGLIHAFDFDTTNGSLTRQRIFAAVDPRDGLPDGLTVDSEDYVWSARWDGGCVVRYAPDGSIDKKIDFPVPKVSSLTFGGPDFTDLYVTTAGGHQKDLDGPLAGSLFVIKDAGVGVPDSLSRIMVGAS